jgi:hypothetical protein
MLEKLSGISPALEGKNPGQATSGVALESLQTASQTVIRMNSRFLEGTLNSIGNKLVSRVFQYCTDDKIFMRTGDAGQLLSYHFEKVKVLGDPRRYFQNFRFDVQPGSALALSRFQKALLEMQLFSLGIVDEQAVLDCLEHPDRVEILQRIAEKQLLQLQMMQAGGGMTPSVGLNQGGPSKGKVPNPGQKDVQRAGIQKPLPGGPDINSGAL